MLWSKTQLPLTLHGRTHVIGNVHWRNTLEQLKLVGPKSLGVSLLTAGFVGMVFTIQVNLQLFAVVSVQGAQEGQQISSHNAFGGLEFAVRAGIY